MRILAVLLLTLLLACNTSSFASQAPCNSGVSLETPTSQEQELAALVNQERTKAGRQPLRLDARLSCLARQYAQDMAVRKFFSHYDPEGNSPFDRLHKRNITYRAAAENLFKGWRDPEEESMKIAHSFLMQSPGHRRNILDSDFTVIGVGVVRTPEEWTYVVELFLLPSLADARKGVIQ